MFCRDSQLHSIAALGDAIQLHVFIDGDSIENGNRHFLRAIDRLQDEATFALE